MIEAETKQNVSQVLAPINASDPRLPALKNYVQRRNMGGNSLPGSKARISQRKFGLSII